MSFYKVLPLVCLVPLLVGEAARADDAALEQAAGRQSNGALALFQQGVELARQGDLPEALARLERARQLSPNWALPYLEIAVLHMSTDNDREAIGKTLDTAARLGGDNPRAHYLYGVYLQEESRRGEAIVELTKALQLRPSMVDARYRLATLYIEDGRQEDGIQQYEYVLKSKGSHVGALRDLALLYEQSGQLEKAEARLKTITVQNPGNVTHLTNLAKFYERVGWLEKARACYREAERLEPTKDPRKLRPLLKTKR